MGGPYTNIFVGSGIDIIRGRYLVGRNPKYGTIRGGKSKQDFSGTYLIAFYSQTHANARQSSVNYIRGQRDGSSFEIYFCLNRIYRSPLSLFHVASEYAVNTRNVKKKNLLLRANPTLCALLCQTLPGCRNEFQSWIAKKEPTYFKIIL